MSFDLLQEHVEHSFDKAEAEVSKITDEILKMEGMSGRKTRHLYNNIVNMPDARYLEIGTWKGSTSCSAMCENSATVVCIDNWSEFGGPKEEFINNFNRYKGTNNASFIESDCFNVDVSLLPKFNIYMYDGNHSHDSHYRALTHFYSCLDDIFIFIVDDWNCIDVRNGTYEAIKTLGFTVLYNRVIRTTTDDSHVEWGSPEQTAWHNGIFVAILEKPRCEL